MYSYTGLSYASQLEEELLAELDNVDDPSSAAIEAEIDSLLKDA
jgi:hypothetical protein